MSKTLQDIKDDITDYFNDHNKVCLDTVQDAFAIIIREAMWAAPCCHDEQET